MFTKQYKINNENIEKAGQIIREGGLVAFPTETVYGLGADALNADAVKSVYQAKGRPSDNPMIVHISEFSQLSELAVDIPEYAKRLMKAFWPGPCTFVFLKKDIVPETTTGGLNTVAVRMPDNETARKLITAARRPIAAPSANLSGKPSPTNYFDVLEDMDGRIDAVLMGEQCRVGIESTIIDVTNEIPVILRPGYITKESVEKVLKSEVNLDQTLFMKPGNEDFKPKAPGMKYRHYAPDAEMKIVAGHEEQAAAKIKELKEKAEKEGKTVRILYYGQDSEKSARNLFTDLREADRQGTDLILAYGLDQKGLGFSVMNRMLKSAGYDIINV